jgi:aspartyl-tRNA(Asn)/glutamyl-tRNA(Gln) amidotransferase subunit C
MPTSDPEPAAELTIEDVRHLATLARLGMTDAELEKFRGELASIICHCDVLQRVDTAGVQPTNNGADLLNVVAADQPRPSWPLRQVLANAPAQSDDLFRVRAVLE